jgi:hypothetical protein
MDISIKKSTGPTGLANVRKLKNSVTVSFAGGDTFEVLGDVKLPPNFANGEYNVVMSADGTKIFGLKPVAGNYIMDFVQVGNQTNGIPDSKILKGGTKITMENGQSFITKDRMVWYVDMKIMAPKHSYDSMEYSLELPFLFVNAPGTRNVMISGTRKQTEKVEGFFRAEGVDLGEVIIPYGPHTSILSFLNDYLQEHHRPIMVNVNSKGWADSVSLVPDQLLPAVKKSRKKS